MISKTFCAELHGPDIQQSYAQEIKPSAHKTTYYAVTDNYSHVIHKINTHIA